MKNLLWLIALVPLALLLVFALGPTHTNAADHRDSPTIDGHGEVDIADIFVCAKPCSTLGSPDGTMTDLIMTVNPLALPGAAASYAFSDHGEYWFYVDNNGDAKPDIGYCIVFGARGTSPSTPQQVKVYKHTSNFAACTNGTAVVNGTTTAGTASSTPNPPTINSVKFGGSFFAGPADDPFFFDLVGFNRLFCCGGAFPRANPMDSFAGANVSAIVLEVPTAGLVGTGNEGGLCPASTCIGVWARTLEDGKVLNRMGRPAIKTVLIPYASRDTYNKGTPEQDNVVWQPVMKASLIALGGGSECTPGLDTLLSPDQLTYDTAQPSAGFPNGRRMTDDVIDTELSLITGCVGISTDGVNSDGDGTLTTSFPYVSLPNVAP